MKDNKIHILVIVLTGILMVVFPLQLGDGALLPFISLVIAVVISANTKFDNYRSKQVFFSISFFYLAVVSHYYAATLHTGALLSTNFSYLLKLTIIPIVIEIIVAVLLVWVSLRNMIATKNGLSVILIGYFTLVSIAMFFSVLLYALSRHSV